MPYAAIINAPGYLPDATEVPAFPTAGDAWAYLEEERRQAEADSTDDGTYVASDCLTTLSNLAELAQQVSVFVPEVGEGTVWGPTPGSDSDHDLGLCYCVHYVAGES